MIQWGFRGRVESSNFSGHFPQGHEGLTGVVHGVSNQPQLYRCNITNLRFQSLN